MLFKHPPTGEGQGNLFSKWQSDADNKKPLKREVLNVNTLND